MKGFLLIVKWSFISALVLMAVGLSAIVLYNVTIPEATPKPEQLSSDEMARLSEVTHLRSELGDEVWPGWGSKNIPILLYNEEYAFLTGMDKPAEGWIRVPYSGKEGGAWKRDPEKGYYRQKLPSTGETPQAFIVRIGEEYAASMTTKDWTRIQLMNMIKADVPWYVAPFIPYGLVINRFDSDWHISGILHESFHAYQAQVNYNRLKKAELATKWEDSYLWDDESFRAKWKMEKEVLAEALTTQDRAKVHKLISEWWRIRNERREKLPADLVDYEKEREWLEGMAKYAELQIWLRAGAANEYTPVKKMSGVSDFAQYSNGQKQWENEINQLKNGNKFSDSMFYYTGWAQAELLDRINDNWKSAVFNRWVYLEDLLVYSKTVSSEL